MRIGGAAAAVLAVAAAPVLVGQATTPNAAKPAEAETTVAVSRVEKRADGALVRLRVTGAPPSGKQYLIGGGGRRTVTVTKSDDPACSNLPLRQVAKSPGGTDWCLHLAGIRDGDDVSGTLKGGATSVKLAATRRNPFVGAPLLWVLLGLAAGGAAIAAPAALRKGARRSLLDDELAENDQRAGEAHIDGLDDFVDDRRNAGDKDDALLPKVTAIIRRGPGIARRARQALAAALAESPLPANLLFRHRAAAVAASTTNAVIDFVAEDGSLLAQHPAQRWLAALKKLTTASADLDELERRITDELKQECRTKPADAAKEAQAAIVATDGPDAVDDLADRVGAVRQTLELQLQDEDCRADAFEELTETAPAPPAPQSEPPAVTAELSLAMTPGTLGWKIAAGIMAVLVILWAIATLAYTVYDPKPAFGRTSDYMALIIAAVGSGAAGSVLALAGIFDPSTTSTD